MYNVKKEWRNLHEEELHNAFSSLLIMIYWRKKKSLKLAGHVTSMGQILTWKILS